MHLPIERGNFLRLPLTCERECDENGFGGGEGGEGGCVGGGRVKCEGDGGFASVAGCGGEFELGGLQLRDEKLRGPASSEDKDVYHRFAEFILILIVGAVGGP